MMREEPDPYRVRERVARREPWRDVSQLSDAELVEEWQQRDEGDEEAWFRRAKLGGNAHGKPQESTPPPVEDLVRKHYIAFEVQDAAGDPYPGLGYVLHGPDAELEEGTLPSSAQLRRDPVTTADYQLVIKAVNEIVWASTKGVCGEDVELRGSTSGHADGTEVEIRIFREFRETDDDVIETLSATVERGQVIATWTYDPSGAHAIEGAHAQLRFVAELRVPEVPGWTKTRAAVVFDLPAIRGARWSERTAAPGKAVEMRVDVAGIADGSPVTIEVFKQRRDGSQERLETFEGLAVTDGVVVHAWTYEADAEDPLAPNEAECFFVATSEDFVDATRTSAPLWISRAVGRRARRRTF